MNYLVVCKSDNQLYLTMTKGEDGKFAVAAYASKEDVMEAFKGFTTAWQRDHTWNASASIGMMQLQPSAIESPENPEDLREYIIDMSLKHISGGVIGRGYYGLPVKETILARKQFDIWHESMVLGGIL